MAKRITSLILYQGPSMLDGSPIVVIATGIGNRSKNSKTGDMIQTHIIRADMLPMEAIWTGADAAICGDCIHRGDGTGKARTCYVKVFQGTTVVYKSFARGIYPTATEADWELFRDRGIRFGSYGDPAAAPLAIWQRLQDLAKFTTGYTHQWRSIDPGFANVCMASADTEADAIKAQRVGYRTFRVTVPGQHPLKNEVLCPASEEAGRKLQCADCKACAGANGRRGSIYIPIHGPNSAAKGQSELLARIPVITEEAA